LWQIIETGLVVELTFQPPPPK